jgi:hypothetical protein
MELESFSQSLWQERHSKNFSFFCPLCTSPRRTAMRPNPYQPILLFRVFLSSLLIALALSPWWGWKGIVAFFPLWIGFELIYRAKARQEIECPHCGFDPFLYMHDPERANTSVKAHFQKRFEERGIPYPPAASPPGKGGAKKRSSRPSNPSGTKKKDSRTNFPPSRPSTLDRPPL